MPGLNRNAERLESPAWHSCVAISVILRPWRTQHMSIALIVTFLRLFCNTWRACSSQVGGCLLPAGQAVAGARSAGHGGTSTSYRLSRAPFRYACAVRAKRTPSTSSGDVKHVYVQRHGSRACSLGAQNKRQCHLCWLFGRTGWYLGDECPAGWRRPDDDGRSSGGSFAQRHAEKFRVKPLTSAIAHPMWQQASWWRAPLLEAAGENGRLLAEIRMQNGGPNIGAESMTWCGSATSAGSSERPRERPAASRPARTKTLRRWVRGSAGKSERAGCLAEDANGGAPPLSSWERMHTNRRGASKKSLPTSRPTD